MQDCPAWSDIRTRGHISIRWCRDHGHWIVSAWARGDGDSAFVEVHPMWLEPRVIDATDLSDGTLSPLLRALQATVQRLADDAATGQMTLW